MLRTPELNRLASRLKGPIIESLLEEDRWRLRHNFFGIQFLPQQRNDSILILGARSGLEIVRILSETNVQKIVVVEAHQGIINEINAALTHVNDGRWGERLQFHHGLDSALDGHKGNRFDYVRVDLFHFERTEVLRLIETCEIGHITGQFDPLNLDPLTLYRACQRHVHSFFWQILGQPHPIHGTHTQFEYEVSVIVPCYQVLPWLDQCLETLVNQTLQSLEIIAVDDGSTDGTGPRLDEWAEKYPQRIRVIHKSNGGCASARNAGLSAARGEFVGFVDPDDWVDLRMFEELYRGAVLNATHVAQCGYNEVYEKSGKSVAVRFSSDNNADHGRSEVIRDTEQIVLQSSLMVQKIYRRQFLTAHHIRFPEHLTLFDDYPFHFEVMCRISALANIPDCFYFYRKEREGQDTAFSDQRLFVHFPIFEHLHQRLSAWINAPIEKCLIYSKIKGYAIHLSQVERKFYWTYLAQAAAELSSHTIHLSAFDLILIARRVGKKPFFYMLCFLLISPFIKPKQIPYY